MTGYDPDRHAHDHSHLDRVASVSCVRHSYADGTSVHLCGLDFLVHRGQRVAILGPNGSGKTTLLYHLLGLLRSQEGEVRVFGVDPGEEWPAVRQRVGVVLQNVDEQLLAPTVADDVAFSPRQYGVAESEVQRRVTDSLELLGIAHLAARVPHNLSGGEKRKVALAGALVMEPELLILDEPFEGLDPASRSGFVALLERLSTERGTTVVMSTHDIDTVPEWADYAYVLAPGGTIVFSGTPAEVFARAELLARGNIKPPILAELFAALGRAQADAPAPALSITDAVDALLRWKHSG